MLTRQVVEIAIQDKHDQNHQYMLQIRKELPQDWTFDAIMQIVRCHTEDGVYAANAHQGLQTAEHLVSICNWMVVLEDEDLSNPGRSNVNLGAYGMEYFKLVAEKYHFKIEGLKTSENPGGLKEAAYAT